MQKPGCTTDPTCESDRRLLALESAAIALASHPSRLLSFPPLLETQFESDSTAARLGRLRLLGLIALLLLNLFNLTDPTMLPDIAAHAMRVRLGIVTPIMALVVASMSLRPLTPWREWLTACLVLLAGGSLIHLFTLSQHANALQYHTGVILIVMFSCIVLRQRFWFALGTNLILLIAYGYAIVALPAMPPEVKLNSIMVLFSAVCISLMANYQLEFDLRRTYLQTLLQRIETIRMGFARDELARQAQSDELTGLANRRSFDGTLQTDWLRAQRNREPIALLYLDVDYFKPYNDHYGHQAGDACLKQVAGIMQQSVQRATDLCARYGGEEFVILLPQTGMANALAIAERLRASIESARIPHAHSAAAQWVTISCGVASMTPRQDQAPAFLVEAADKALYVAKQSGRNRISGYSRPTGLPPGPANLTH